MRLVIATIFLTLTAAAPRSSTAQQLTDTLFTWQSYAQTAQCRVQIFTAPPKDERSHTIVVRELAANRGPSTITDADYLVEEIGRHFGIDPAQAYWVFHWGSFSYVETADAREKELFVRATFRRTKQRNLSSPYWRVITREEVEDYTDRHFQ